MGLSQVAYGAYERRLLRRLDPDRLPRHVGAIVDGNRRWAKDARMGLDQGYRAGAAKVDEFLDWCHELGVGTVTFWVLSTDNLQRPDAELASILDAVEDLVGRLAEDGRWHVRLIGNLQLLPADSSARLQRAAAEVPGAEGGRRVRRDEGPALLARDELVDVDARLVVVEGLEAVGRHDELLRLRAADERVVDGRRDVPGQRALREDAHAQDDRRRGRASRLERVDV